MVERFNGRISEVVQQTRFASAAELDATLTNYMLTYNHHIPQCSLGHLSPIDALKSWREKKPELFQKRIYKQAELDIYLTAVVDVASRQVLAHKTATTLEACHAREVIEQAFARFGLPEIVNTDQGSQFTAAGFTDAVLCKGCKLSMDGRGAWRDNVFVERLWRSVKYERVYLKAYDSVSAARADIADYFRWYNTERPHSSLENGTPEETYLNLLPRLAEAA